MERTPAVEHYADAAIIGGGPSGVCAAIAAARTGAKTLLVEQNGYAGGMATQGLVGPFMTCYDRDGEDMILKGLFEEVVDRLVARGGALHPSGVRAGTGYSSWLVAGHDHVTPFDPEILKCVLDDMLLETKVEVLYHTGFLRPVVEDGGVTGAVLASKAGIGAVRAKVFVDCTGDGDVAHRAGAPCLPAAGQGPGVQPATLFLRVGNVDDAAVEAEIEAHRDDFYRKDGINYRSFHWLVTKARENGDWTLDRVSVGLYKGVRAGEWSVNTSRIMGIDATDNVSLTYGEMTGRRQADEILRFLRKYVPGCEDARLLATGATLGIRESRHIEGEAVLTVEDVLAGSTPPSSILVCANAVDIHGYNGPKSNHYVTVRGGRWYGVPYGCLVPLGVDGLLVAGRCFSATSEAAGAVRVMPPCMCMGQAAGVAAALCAATGVSPRALSAASVREVLRAQGAFLPV